METDTPETDGNIDINPDAVKKLAIVILDEFQGKHAFDPREPDWNEDYGWQITINVGEAKRFLEAVLRKNEPEERTRRLNHGRRRQQSR